MKKILLLGSTGSIGTQTLEIVRLNPEKFEIVGLASRRGGEGFAAQIEEFCPEAVAVYDEAEAQPLRARFPKLLVYAGADAAEKLAESAEYDILLNALVGIAGLAPTAAAIPSLAKRAGYIALANKETLVAGGRFITESAKKAGVSIVPVDSEHSAIFQCLGAGAIEGGAPKPERLILTASGGAFRGKTRDELKNVAAKDALAHPNWTMGQKVTVDSATLLNKGLEIIEAKWLFDMPNERIDVLVHPQSIVHSLISFSDGAMLAQLGLPDMKVPISYALTFPERGATGVSIPDLAALGALIFEKPDIETFKCLKIAREAIAQSERLATDSETIALNAASEELTKAFIARRIDFLDIGDKLEEIMNAHEPRRASTLPEIFDIDSEVRTKTQDSIA